jgi:hypothetical protein
MRFRRYFIAFSLQAQAGVPIVGRKSRSEAELLGVAAPPQGGKRYGTTDTD